MERFSAKRVHLFLRSRYATAWLLAVFFIIVLSVTVSWAQVNQSPVSILNLGDGQVLSQDYLLKFETQGSFDFIDLYFIRLDVSTTSKAGVAQRDKMSGDNFWSYQLHINDLANGSYRLEAVGVLADGNTIAGQTRNFSILRSTVPQPSVTIIQPLAGTVASGDMKIIAQASGNVNQVVFSVLNPSGVLLAQPPASAKTNDQFEAVLATDALPDGEYRLRAHVAADNAQATSSELIFYIDNHAGGDSDAASSTPISVQFISPPPQTVITDRTLFQVITSPDVTSLYFRFGKNFVTALRYDQNRWQAYLSAQAVTPGAYEIIAVARFQEREYFSPILPIIVRPTAPEGYAASSTDAHTGNEAGKSPQNSPTVVISSPETNPPVTCENEDIKNITCDVYLRNRQNFSESCVSKVLDVEACLRTEREQQTQCEQLGFTDISLCRRYLQEPRVARWCGLSEFRDQPICADYQRTVSSTVPASQNNDSRCQEQHLDDPALCERYLVYLRLPVSCKQAGKITLKSCTDWLRSTYLTPACQRLAVTDETACEQRLVAMVSDSLQCESDSCLQDVGVPAALQLAARQERLERLRAVRAQLPQDLLAATDWQRGDIRPLLDELPVEEKQQAFWQVLDTEDSLTTVNGQLLAPLPFAIMKDTDGDGLPDDIERRLGTNSRLTDTDGDGYSDGTEVKNGYDPLQPGGTLEKPLAPVEKAILSGRPLAQALVSGEVSGDLHVLSLSNQTSDETENALTVSGSAPAYSVLTIYIYSDLPLVATVQTDEYGRWQYTVENSLIDGEHQVFVAINDDTGRIQKKSLGRIFFINQARAATVGEVVNLAAAEDASSIEKYYLQGAVVLVLLAVLMFLLFRRSQRGLDNQSV